MNTPSPRRTCRRIVVTNDSDIADYGLTIEQWREVAEQGEREARQTTDNDPRNARGNRRWFAHNRVLREFAIEVGAEVARPNNHELTLFRERKLALFVMRGDRHTGLDTPVEPRSWRPFGLMTQNARKSNAIQLDFFIPAPDEGQEPIQLLDLHKLGPEYRDWLFVIVLTHRDRAGMRMELSIPVGCDEEGFITRWSERRILPAVPFLAKIPRRKRKDDPSKSAAPFRRKSS